MPCYTTRSYFSLSNIRMQQLARLARGLASPAILMVVVWSAASIAVGIGPIDYPMQPTPVVLVLIAAGVSLFSLACWAGVRCFSAWFGRRSNMRAPSTRLLNQVVIATSLVGVAGIGLMALDRLVFSGLSNGGYAELLRCAPWLVDIIEIKRTPLLYVGYLTFSFGSASLVLFFLKGDEIDRGAAALAQISILSPVGHALLYSGRMPILLVIVLIVSAILLRIRQGKPPVPRGHHLVLKTAVVFLLFLIYSSSMWSSRQNFCVQMTGLVRELQQRMTERDIGRGSPSATIQQKEGQNSQAFPNEAISAADLNKMIAEARMTPAIAATDGGDFLAKIKGAWHVKPRPYVISAIDSGILSPSAAMSFLSTYFYLTHGIRVLDATWRAREQFSPQWGVYEIGVLSPMLRVFFPQGQRLAEMERQLKSAEIYGFFPTAWGSAYIDFGMAGAIIYIWIWGFVAGWSDFGARHSGLVTPSLLLTFVLASIFLSLVQGPLGIANSALVLLSMIAAGLAIDLALLKKWVRQGADKFELERPVT